MIGEEFTQSLYHYRGTMLRIIDGDTVEVRLELGVSTSRTIRVRIAGINAPELFSGTMETRAQGEAARAYILCDVGKEVLVKTYKDGKTFDRYIADVYVMRGLGWQSIAQLQVDSGNAVWA